MSKDDDNRIAKEELKALGEMKSSKGWKFLKKKMDEKKRLEKELYFQCNAETEDGKKNARTIKAFALAIEAFYEEVDDVIHNLKMEIDGVPEEEEE